MRRTLAHLFVALIVFGSGLRATEACAPSATVEGSAAIVSSVTDILRAHGVSPGSSGCGDDVRAVLAPKAAALEGGAPRGYVLRLADRFGRSNQREVSTPEAAASLIESWVVGEDTDLVVPRAAAAAPAPAPNPLPDAVPWLGASGEISSTSDGLTGYGAGVFGCARLGWLCVGGRALYAHATGPFAGAGVPVPGAELIRDTMGGLLGVGLPWRSDRFAVSPLLGVGAAWMRTEVALDGFSVSSSDAVALVDGTLVAEISIAGGWSVLGAAGATWQRSLASGNPQGTAMYLPTPPSRFLHAGIGVGYSP